MTTRQANDTDVKKHSGVLMRWSFAVIADQDRIYSAIKVVIFITYNFG